MPCFGAKRKIEHLAKAFSSYSDYPLLSYATIWKIAIVSCVKQEIVWKHIDKFIDLWLY